MIEWSPWVSFLGSLGGIALILYAVFFQKADKILIGLGAGIALGGFLFLLFA